MRPLPSLMLVALQSCATIMGSPDQVPIASDPPGAVIIHRNSQVGMTPATITIPKGEDATVTLRRDGFHDQLVEVGRSLNGWIFGNILFGGPVGIVIDIASGASSRLDAAPISIPLVPIDQPAPIVWTREGKGKPKQEPARPEGVKTWTDDAGWTHVGG